MLTEGSIEFWFDLSTTFLRAVMAVLVFLGGAREHILALWGLIFTFSKIFTRPDVLANFVEFLSMFRRSNLGLKWRKYTKQKNKQYSYTRVLEGKDPAVIVPNR